MIQFIKKTIPDKEFLQREKALEIVSPNSQSIFDTESARTSKEFGVNDASSDYFLDM